MKIQESTQKYEAWLAKHTTLLADDLKLKHERMAGDAFAFLRATFYRWMQLWPEVCPELTSAPPVLGVGDLHVENFGTWRDTEGRLIWGINDFDEAHPMPYTVDLVRLATSARLAIATNDLVLEPKDACEAILTGYREGLEAGGRAFVLEEHHHALRKMAMSEFRDPVSFWEKMDELPTLKHAAPSSARETLERALPEPGLSYRLAHRVAGLGSLGRQRFVAIAAWRGGRVAREVKALVPSACLWARGSENDGEILYEKMLVRAVRCPDPYTHWREPWIVRRLAPHCTRIELGALPKQREEVRLLEAMGWETVNVHLGSQEAIRAVREDLKKRSADWLHAASKNMLKATTEDWEKWRKS